MRAGRNVARAAAAVIFAACVVLVGGLQGVAVAAPIITIEHPLAGSSTNNQSLPFSGTTTDMVDAIVLTLHQGGSTGSVVQTLHLPTPLLGTWETAPESPLAEGQYTAVAEQTSLLETETGTAEVTFTVDTTPPAVTMSLVASPTNDPTPTLKGSAGTAEGDNPAVTVMVYQGNVVGGTVAASETVAASGGVWSYTTPHLGDGTYTAQASQSDEPATPARANHLSRSQSIRHSRSCR